MAIVNLSTHNHLAITRKDGGSLVENNVMAANGIDAYPHMQNKCKQTGGISNLHEFFTKNMQVPQMKVLCMIRLFNVVGEQQKLSESSQYLRSFLKRRVFSGTSGDHGWFGFLGSPYERACYLGVPVESQTTNPNHQVTIS